MTRRDLRILIIRFLCGKMLSGVAQSKVFVRPRQTVHWLSFLEGYFLGTTSKRIAVNKLLLSSSISVSTMNFPEVLKNICES